MSEIYVGTSAWKKPQWRGAFYPTGLVQSRELQYVSRQLSSLEINATSRGLQSPATFSKWRDETPDGFVFSVKALELATRSPHLRNAGRHIDDFFASGIYELKDKLGPILWQFPAALEFDGGEVEAFLGLLPPGRHAIEARNASFVHPEFLAIARGHNVAIAYTNSSQYPQIRELTADFAYVRLSSGVGHFEEGYDDQTLDVWAHTIRDWNRDAFVYFNNPAGELVHTPFNALRLIERVGRPERDENEGTLF